MNRAQIESVCTENRIRELWLNPVHGNFDAAHLKEINRRIFQDLPGLGFSDVTPGQFRPSVPAGLDWIKTRSLESINATSSVAYSRMDKAAQQQLDTILTQADPEKLSQLKTAEFTRAIGKLYSEIDFIHPFKDGNSRSLREFTRQLAEESGYPIDWQRFNRQPAGRDILYIARDIDVNRQALPHIQDFGARRDVTYTLDVFSNNRNLSDLLRDAIRPSRSIAFEKLPEDRALRKHPELAEAYKTLHKAERYFLENLPNETARQQAISAVKACLQTRLNEGETRGFQPLPGKSQEKRPAREADG